MTPRRWIEYLIAILLGNGIYFAVLHGTLPAPLRHQPFAFDPGLAIDFACCLLVYAAIRLGSRRAHARRESAASEARFGQSTDPASEKESLPTRRENAASEARVGQSTDRASEKESLPERDHPP